MTANQTATSRTFTVADQEMFAEISGDRNPIHMDQMAARRTQAGAPVVHGVHGLLWALDAAARTEPLGSLNVLSVKFQRYLYLDVQAQMRVVRRDQTLLVELIAGGQVVTTAKLEFGALGLGSLAKILDDAPVHALGAAPDPVAFEDMGGRSGRLAQIDEAGSRRMFPALSEALGARSVAAIALVSGVVGMSCPGLHSLFSQLTLRRLDGDDRGLAWRTSRTEPRTRWVGLEVAGQGWEGEVIAFARPEPVEARSMDDLSGLVGPDEFRSRTALIIGGSRGLGAVTAKLLAAGGAQVVLTYARGDREARTVSAEINAARRGPACSVIRCDVTEDVAEQLASLPANITHLYYFATPQIARQQSDVFSRAILDSFLSIYVDGFAAVWDALADVRPLSILYPSTVFIDERPKGMTEYVMAKVAAETLCADLARRQPGLAMLAPRIPRTLTDQTATSPPIPAADPITVMLPLLRSQVSG